MAKRENESFSIQDLMQNFIQENNLQTGMQKVRVVETWNNLMGQGVTNYTEQVALKKSTLVVHLSSSVLREELSYGKEKIIKMMNDELGEEIISKLVLT